MNSHGLIIRNLVIAVICMFGFGFALVPLYDVFCQITGINGRIVNRVDANTSGPLVDESRLVTIEFITSTANGANLVLNSKQKKIKIHPGQMSEAMFEIENPNVEVKYVQAIPSVSPGEASLYLNKTECFCFSPQVVEAKGSSTYPLRFFLDVEFPEHIKVLTLSYTLYEVKDQSQKKQDAKGQAQSTESEGLNLSNAVFAGLLNEEKTHVP